MFEVNKFNSGEWNVKLIDRLEISESPLTVRWDWFTEPDIMILLMKIDAIRRNYSKNTPIKLDIPYLPYARQERLFEIGQSVPLDILCNIFTQNGITEIYTLGCHTNMRFYYDNKMSFRQFKLELDFLRKDLTIFPDKNASSHFYYKYKYIHHRTVIFDKIRDAKGIKTQISSGEGWLCAADSPSTVWICDDICDGGRTFVECAKILKTFPQIKTINLLIYHAFMSHGVEELQKYIDKIYIINPYSYTYICNKFPEYFDYFSNLRDNDIFSDEVHFNV